MLTRNRLMELLSYDPDTGIFKWRVNRGGMKPGELAGKNGRYVVIRIDGRCHSAHRLAWLYVYGDWPKCQELDHINRDPCDNRIGNLREATAGQNRVNSSKQRKTRTGIRGVYPSGKRFMACITSGKRQKYIGTFDTIEEAVAARLSAATREWGEFLP